MKTSQFLASPAEEDIITQRRRPANSQAWTPSQDQYKLNTDVVRDRKGDPIGSFCDWREDLCNVAEVEAMTIQRGLEVARDIDIRSLCVEADCMEVIAGINSMGQDRTAVGMILEDIKTLASYFTSFSFMFVRRSCNRVAHLLANYSREIRDFRVWMEEVLNFCNDALLNDYE